MCSGYLIRSANGGANWNWCDNGHKLDAYNSPFKIHPTSSNIIYAAYFDKTLAKAAIVKSTNYGQSFDLTNHVGTEWGATTAFDVSPSNPNIILFATYDVWNGNYGNLRLTFNSGSSWNNAETGLQSIINKAQITDIYYQKNDSYTAWICFSGFENGKRVYKSTSSGIYWNNITYNLPTLPINSIIYDDERNYLYAATDVGVYCLKDGTTTWIPLGVGLPSVMVTKLKINFKDDKLVASTYGAGLWTYDLGPVIRPGGSKKSSAATTGIDIFEKETVQVVPNPVTGKSTISFDPIITKGTIRIYDILGKVEAEFVLQKNDDAKIINKSDFKEGIYMIILTEDGVISGDGKFVIGPN